MSRKRNYLNNKDLLTEILISKEKNNLTHKAVEYITLMVDKIGLEFHYRFGEDYDDCRSEALINVLKYWKNFNVNKSENAFSYYTQQIKTGYAIGYNKIYKKRSKTIPISQMGNSIYNI